MDKGKTTRILSGGGTYIGKDGKRHEWSKAYGYKPTKITDDNWMEYGMPADDETNESKNMNKRLIRLTESDLHKIVKESVKRVLKEDDTQNLGINNYDPTNYDELNMKIKAIMSKVSEIRNMIEDISTSQLDVAQNAGNLDGLAEELYRQLRYTLHKANTSNYIEA